MKRITLDTARRRPFTLGNVGEQEALAITVDVPAEYREGRIYLDFLLPDGTKTQTPALGEDNTFIVPNELLRMRGRAEMDVVYKKEDTVEVLARFQTHILPAVNATQTLVVTYRDVIEDLVVRMEALEDGSTSGKSPYIHPETGTWMVYDDAAGAWVNTQVQARGADGAQGEPGEPGLPGERGAKGDAATVTVGAVTTGEAGTPAQVKNVGTAQDAVFDFVIPKGDKADPPGVYELIETITVTEEVSAIQRTQEPDGTPYWLKGLLINYDIGAGSASGNLQTWLYPGESGKSITAYFGSGINTGARYYQNSAEIVRGKWTGWKTGVGAAPYEAPVLYGLPMNTVYLAQDFPACTRVFISATTSGVSIPVGSIIQIYGVRA